MLASIASGAQARCASEKDQSAFDVGALKSQLSVLAVDCQEEDGYNSFVTRDRSELVAEDAVVNAWFKRTFGKGRPGALRQLHHHAGQPSRAWPGSTRGTSSAPA